MSRLYTEIDKCIYLEHIDSALIITYYGLSCKDFARNL